MAPTSVTFAFYNRHIATMSNVRICAIKDAITNERKFAWYTNLVTAHDVNEALLKLESPSQHDFVGVVVSPNVNLS